MQEQNKTRLPLRAQRQSRWFLSFGLIVGLVGGLLFAPILTKQPPRAGTPLSASLLSPKFITSYRNTPPSSFVQAAERILPSVVAVSCLRVFSARDLSRYREAEPRDRAREPGAPLQTPEMQQRSGGSGIIISPDGYILTNTHVVDFADKITVTLNDRRTFPAKIIGLDPLSEIAVIKIEAQHLTPAAIGDSQTSNIGEWVLAVGNPLELRFTVTAGIISAKGRQINVIQESFGVEHFIQTDAAINPGNSGGGLFNLKGEVVGVITAIATETGYDVGLGFAVPINLAHRIAVDLMRHGRVERGYLGVAMRNVRELEARALGLESPAGVFIDDLYEDSPARKGGLQPMDVILSIDGFAVSQTNDVQALVAGKKPGALITLKIFRNHRELTQRLVLGQLPLATEQPLPTATRAPFKDLGISVANLTSADLLALKRARSGVKVTAVERFSPAEEAGLLINDIILALNRQPIRGQEDFGRRLRTLKPGEAVILAVVREDALYHLFLEVL